MPVLREVITRFKFDTDRKGVNRFNRTMNQMRGNVRGLGRLLGISLGIAGARSLFNMGQGAQRAQFNLKRLVGTDFRPLRRTLKDIRAEMNAITVGSGQLIRTKDFDIAAGGFFRAFGRGSQQLKFFRETFAFAAKQAAITGRNVVEIFSSLQAGITGGDFGELLELPGFDKVRQQMIQFQQQAIDPDEPGGRVAIRNRMRVLSRIIRESAIEQNRALGTIPAPLLEADKAADQFRESMDRIAKVMSDLMVPALKNMNILLSRFVAKMDEIDNKGAKALLPLLVPNILLPKKAGQKTATETTMGGSTTNIFNIQSNDPDAVAREVKRRLDETIGQAARAIVPTEDR